MGIGRKSMDDGATKPDLEKVEEGVAEAPVLTRRDILQGAAVAGTVAAIPASTLIPSPADAEGRSKKKARGRSKGTIVRRKEDRFPALTQGFNRRFEGHPTQIAYVESARDIEIILERAARKKKGVTIRSGGHCYEGWCVNPGIAGMQIETLIDMSLMTGIYKETRDRRLRGSVAIEAGAELWHVYRYMYQAFGATPPAGSCYSVCAGGHISGGGYGLMSRLQGVVVDHVVGLEIVVLGRNGRARTLIVTEHDTGAKGELFWAVCGGGGGNFGVVTRFWVRPLDAMNAVQITQIDFSPTAPVEELAQILQVYGAFWEENNRPDPQDPTNQIFGIMKLNVKRVVGAGGIREGASSLLVQWSVEDEEDLGPVGTNDPFTNYMLEALNGDGIETTGTSVLRYGWLEAAQTLNGSGPNQRGKYKSAYMKENFTPEEALGLAEFTENRDGHFDDGDSGLIQIDSFGGMVNAQESDFRAYPHRSSCLALQWHFHWYREPSSLQHEGVPDARDEEIIGWVNRGYEQIYGPDGPMDGPHYEGTYVNYPDSALPRDKYGELYYIGNYPRLQAAKKRWDPLNFFRFDQSIQPQD